MRRLRDILVRGLEAALVAIFGLMVLDVLWQVVSRYVVGASSSFTEEFARFALIWLTLLGAAYLNARREHLAMDFLTRRLPPARRAARARRVEWGMLALALVVLVVGGGNLAYTQLRLGQVSAAIGVPLGVVYAVVPVAGLLIAFFSACHLAGLAPVGSAPEGEVAGGRAASAKPAAP